MAKRMQSPSSINLYKQCPRKYYYQYILKLPTKPSIHLIRGSIVHEILEKFFSLDVNQFDENEYEYGLRSYVSASLLKQWKESKNKLMKLELSKQELETYLIESQQMLNNFVTMFSEKLKEKMIQGLSLEKAFEILTPAVEEEIRNEELQVRGFIDAIHSDGNEIVIMDYKTSNKDTISPEYRLQLGIYALLYKLKHNETPTQVGINFLKFTEQKIDVTDELLNEAEFEIKFVHANTESENIRDYEPKESGLCKWHSGQCDFYDECIKNR